MANNQVFKVRSGLVVHRERIVERGSGRATVKSLERQSFGEAIGAPALVELTPAEVARHAHALEPYPISEGDPSSAEKHKATAAVLERHHAKLSRQPTDTLAGYEERIAAAAVTAVLEALKVAGVLQAPRK